MFYKIKDYIYLVAGSLVSALALDMFLAPNKIAPGGASGLGTILYNAVNIPVSVTVFAVNFLLFVFGYKRLGKKVVLKTFLATVLMSGFIQLFSFLQPFTHDLLLATVLGGAMLGLGSGLTIISGASTGGTDFLAIILNGVFQHISIANFILIIDLFISILAGFVFKDYALFLYGLFGLYVCTQTVDKVINGFNYARLVYVISDKNDEIANYVLNDLNMGVTALYGKGMYKNRNQLILMCAMRRNDFPKFRKAVKTADENAFIILTEANEVLGEGFNK